LETLKGRRVGLAIVLLLGLAVFTPAVRAPLFLDDYLHVAMVEGTFPAPRGPLDLYDFVDDGDRAALAMRGLLPWWTTPELTIRFFRPLSSALLWWLHRASSHDALVMHLHSLAWWLAAVLAVRAVLRRFLTERAALVGTAVFALSPCHALPLAWIANSEILVALAFGALALVHQLRFRSEGSLARAATASALFTLSLLGGGEYALAFGGYVLAIELARRRRPDLPRPSWPSHLARVLPFGVPALAYLVVRSALGYGATGSGFYTDPFRDPLEFARLAPYRAVSLLADAWLTLGTDAVLSTYDRLGLVALVLALGGALYVPIRRAIAALAPEPAFAARALVWGSLLALAPTLAVVPAFRLLGVAMIGVAATTAILLEHAWFSAEARSGTGSPLVTLAALLLAFAQLVHGPVTATIAARLHRRDGQDFAARVAAIARHVGEPTSADVGIVRGMAGIFFAPFALDPRGRQPRRWRVLSHAGHVLVLRPDARTVELVVPENRSLYPIGVINLYRPVGSPLREGDVVRTADMTVTILEIGELGPRRARFVFDEAPAAVRWIADNFDGTAAVELPPVGQGAPFDP
jgi:hypothetical protein